MRKKPFDLSKALERAIQFIVAKMEEGQKEAPDWHVNQYFSATDVASRVRSAVAEEVDGRPYGTYGVTGHAGGVRISGLGGMSLLDHCRAYLGRLVIQGKLRTDHPSGKRVCSGLRFRPAHWELTEAEKRGQQAKEKKEERGEIYHYVPNYDPPHNSFWRPLCLEKRQKHTKSTRYRPRSFLRKTKDPTKVTCQLCLKLMKKMSHPLAPELALLADPLVVADWLEDHNQPERAQELRRIHQP